MANREIEAILKISSKLGSMRALGTLQRELGKIDKQAKAFNRSQAVIAQTGAKAAAATARLLAPLAVAYGVKRSFVEYAEVERRLNRIAVNADLGKEAVQGMLDTINATSHEYALGQDQVTEGLETMIAAGMDMKDALAFLPSVAATAQASGSAVNDLALSAFSVSTAFGVTSDKMQEAFDIMAKGGKLGQFELRDMAQYLPTLSASFSSLGYKGNDGLIKLVGLMQTVRIHTADASTAATDLQNIFQKMYSQETAKRFAKFGVDITRELDNARKTGGDVLDTFLRLTQQISKGDPAKLALLFSDQQMYQGIQALLKSPDALARFNDELRKSDGTVLRDNLQILSDTKAKIDQMSSSLERFNTSLGGAIAGPVSNVLNAASDYIDFDQAITKGLTKRGLSPDQQATWRARHLFDSEARGLAAFDGDWRSAEYRDTLKGPHTMADAAAIRAAERSQALPVRGVNGLPTVAPVPTARPEPNMVLPDLTYNRFVPPSPEGMQRQIESERAKAIAAIDNAGPGGIRAMMMGAGEDIRQAGDAAGQSIQNAARAINDAGSTGGGAFARMLDGVGTRIGADAAAAFNARVKLPSGAGVRGVNADVGRSGDDVQASGGQ